MTLEEQLEKDVTAIVHKLEQQQYVPTKFKGMITEHGVLVATKALIGNPKIHDGLTTMILKEIDLKDSLEYLVYINHQYHPLFTPEELQTCKSKLKQLQVI